MNPGAVGADPDPTPPAGAAPDLDPTPVATPWQEYLAAAQALDAVLREAAAEAEAATRANSSSLADLAQVRSLLDGQRARLIGAAVRAGLPAPELVPNAAEQAEAYAQVGGDLAAAADALRHARRLAAQADAHLAGLGYVTGEYAAVGSPVPPPRPANPYWPPPLWLAVTIPLTAAALVLCGLTGFLVLVR
jgi:hypothetical protein